MSLLPSAKRFWLAASGGNNLGNSIEVYGATSPSGPAPSIQQDGVKVRALPRSCCRLIRRWKKANRRRSAARLLCRIADTARTFK